jgi:mannose-6-phosphate isomerase
VPPCPLVFEPIFRPKVWGGRNLANLLGKRLPEGQAIGESWECADLPASQSVVSRGPAAGRTLHDLIDEWRADLTGRAELAAGRFPLLIKFLDAADALSVQVHPAAGAGPLEVKEEAWYVLHARAGAVIYRGLRPGISPQALAETLAAEPARVVDLLQPLPARPGDSFALPAGTVHALGAGIVVAEVQTPSDTTYRLYDWGRARPGDDGGLHVEQALACVRTPIDFAPLEKRSHVTSVFTTVTRLITCPAFVIEKVRFVADVEQDIPYAEPVCWIVLEGRGEILHAGGAEQFSRGDVVLLPAGLRQGRLRTMEACTWLEVTLPVPSDLAGLPHPGPEQLRAGPPAGLIQLHPPRGERG